MSQLDDFGNAYRPLLSLADQKTLKIQQKLAEKNERMDESPLLTPIAQQEAQATRSVQQLQDALRNTESTNLGDIFESSYRQGIFQTGDFLSGQQGNNEFIREYADELSGVTPEGRERLVDAPNRRVTESLAAAMESGNPMDFVRAIPDAVRAGPGVLADSLGAVAGEVVIGAGLTKASGGMAPLAVAGRRVQKTGEAVADAVDAVDDARKTTRMIQAGKQLVKTGGQMSVVTADITQRQINDYVDEYGERPSGEWITQMYAINLATMMAQGEIVKQLFIPDFKKEIVKEVRTLAKNLGSGSNFQQMGFRIGDLLKKVSAATGAEAAQEYFQTWAEIINTQVKEDSAEGFFNAVRSKLGKEDNQLDAIVGAYLGGGAGLTARTATAAPTTAAGVATDLTKATAKGVVKGTARVTQKIANDASYKVLSENERAEIRQQYETRREVVDEKVAEMDKSIETVQAAKDIETLRGNEEFKSVVDRIQVDLELTDAQMNQESNLKRVQDAMVRAYKADQALLRTELEASNVADIAKKVGSNVKAKAVEKAKAVVDAIPVDIDTVIKGVEKFGEETVQAVKEIRSSTALGIIEMANDASKENMKTMLTAAQSLDLADLERTAAIVGQKDTEAGRRLRNVVAAKKRAMRSVNQLRNDVINEENIPAPIKTAVADKSLDPKAAKAFGLTLTDALNSRIQDIPAMEAIEAALEIYAATPGVSERDIEVLRNKAKAAGDKVRSTRLKKAGSAAKKAGGKAVDLAKKVIEKATPAAKKAGEAAVDAAQAVEDAVDDFVDAPKKNWDPDTVAKFKTVAEGITDEDSEIAAAEQLNGMAAALRKAGVKTAEDFQDFLRAAPEFRKNAPGLTQILENQFTDVVMDQETDNMNTKNLSEEEIDAKFDQEFPGCKA